MELNEKEVCSLAKYENKKTRRILCKNYWLYIAFLSNFRYVSKPLYDVLRKLDLVWQNALKKGESVEFADKIIGLEIDQMDIVWV